MDEIQLIVNADDLGNGQRRDRGIFRACTAGIVTSVSLLANGPTFVAAARESLTLGLPLGVHLNLSEGRALGGAIAGLTDATGNFPGKKMLRMRLASGDFDRAAVRHELLSQIARVRDAGLHPDHLDTHQHCFLSPALTGIIVAVARETAITALRLPVPAEPVETDPAGELGADLSSYRRLAAGLAAIRKEPDLYFPDGLWGMPLLNRLTAQRLETLLTQLPAGTWELMTHPGYSADDEPFSGPARERELAALTAPTIRALIATREIKLTTFGACRCTC